MSDVEEDRLLRIKQVTAVTGLSRASIYEKVRRGEFPAPVKIGKRAVAWRFSKIIEWISSLAPASDEKDGGAS
ncbi:helix-turn-helix transcriptional regulator [Rhodosalinus sediminis]|uniref:helix-turn-helix transcriptional regulator n=1 Tax=Rhodosalinus sediminis TaxID=1940533 RepID=UPI002356BEB5|nr:AlpA family transcriptional regulator [Rhodosalinus sediminis]